MSVSPVPTAGSSAGNLLTPPPTAAGTSGAAGAAGTGVSGAAGAGAGGATAPVAGSLPCSVTKALVTNCQKCHGAQLVGGAPMSLLTYADFKKMAVTKPALTVQALALMRLNDAAAPMPPGGMISAEDKKTLTDWLSAGAPTAATGDTCTVAPGDTADNDYKSGLTAKPGETCYNLLNHNANTPGDTTPYSVATGEHYEQFYSKVPWPAGMVATRFGSKLDNVAVLHHWLLFSSAKALTLDGTHETVSGSQIGDTARLLAGWAVGGDNVTLPDDMGLELPASGLLNLQWHFYNQGTTSATDASMVQICTVPAAMKKNIVSMTWLGTENLSLPSHQTATASGTCLNDSNAPITIWAFWPHMHKLGRRMTSAIKRSNGMLETVFDKAFDFNHQVHYPQIPMLVLNAGDSIVSTCTFDNETDAAVRFGSSTTKEMCYQFAYSYPAHALDNGVPSLIGASNTCW
jgi:hypothetical protein